MTTIDKIVPPVPTGKLLYMNVEYKLTGACRPPAVGEFYYHWGE